jgi:MarR family transcriptional regulator, temperature-dependent positive regulator of motility
MKTQTQIDQHQIEYLYQTNFVHQVDIIRDEHYRKVMQKNNAQGYDDLKVSFSAVLSNMSFEGSKLVDIAKRTNMTKQALGQIANEIEALGYVKRVPDAKDGRAKNLVFTNRGVQLISNSITAVMEIEREFSDLIGIEKISQLKAIINELATAIEGRRYKDQQ